MKFEQALGLAAMGLLSWGSYQMYCMNANMTLATYKIDQNQLMIQENYNMIKPMWEDFLVRRGQYTVNDRE